MAMNEENLATAMARSHFGPFVGETVRLLLTNPYSSLADLIERGTPFCNKQFIAKDANAPLVGDKAKAELFRDCLGVLIQHGIVCAVERRVSAPEVVADGTKRKRRLVGNPDRTKVVYLIELRNLLFRSRMPLYLGFVRRRYGDVGEAAVRTLFERGKLTSGQLFSTALNEALTELDISPEDAEACLTDMAQSGLLHWAGKRGSGRSTSDRNARAEMPDDDDQPLRGRKRLRLPEDSDDSDDAGEQLNGSNLPHGHEKIRVGRGDHVIVVGAPSRRNNEDIWSICFWHLNREFRIECCVIVVRGRVQHDLALHILRAGLQLALEDEDCVVPSEDFETADIPTDAIQKHLADQDAAVSPHDFWEAIQVLINQTPQFVMAIPEHSPTALRFIPGRLVADVRQKTLEDLLVSRYGGVGRRVFRALAIDGAMDEKMLADKCMLPLKVVRENLFRMYQDRIVTIQEVPRSHDQQRASNWYYLWQANTMAVFRSMTQVLSKAVLNLFVRLECLEAKGAAENEEKQKQLDIHKSLVLGSILRLDQSIMVLRDFGPVTTAYFPSRYRMTDGPMGRVKKKRW